MDQLLRALELSEKDIVLFKALYSVGSATPAELARMTGLNRSTAYVILEDLLKRGLISEDASATQQTFVALQPDELLGLIPQMEAKLKEKEENIHQLVDTLKTELKGKDIHIPKMMYIPEDKIEKHLYARTPVWNRSIHDADRDIIGYYDHTFVDLYHEWIDWYYKQPSAKGIGLRLLTNETEFEKSEMQSRKYEKRNIQFWEGMGNITYSTWVYGDYTLLVNTHTHPFSIIEIFDPQYAQSQTQLFEAVWKEVVKK